MFKKTLTATFAVLLLTACGTTTGPGNNNNPVNDNIEPQNFRTNDMNNPNWNNRNNNFDNNNFDNNFRDNNNLNRRPMNDNFAPNDDDILNDRNNVR